MTRTVRRNFNSNNSEVRTYWDSPQCVNFTTVIYLDWSQSRSGGIRYSLWFKLMLCVGYLYRCRYLDKIIFVTLQDKHLPPLIWWPLWLRNVKAVGCYLHSWGPPWLLHYKNLPNSLFISNLRSASAWKHISKLSM